MQEKNKTRRGKEKTGNKMVDLIPSMTIIILNLSRLNTPIKSQRLSELIIKQDPSTSYLQETQL